MICIKIRNKQCEFLVSCSKEQIQKDFKNPKNIQNDFLKIKKDKETIKNLQKFTGKQETCRNLISTEFQLALRQADIITSKANSRQLKIPL